jgi:hypothetical protein
VLRLPGRLMHRLLVLALALTMAAAAGAVALAWRLSEGPLNVDWAARRMEAVRNTPGATTRLTIGHASIRWSGFAKGVGQGLELQLEDVRLTDLKGAELASVRVFDLSVSMARLLLGQAAPRVVSVTGLNLRLLRDTAGAITIDLGGIDLVGDADPAAPVADLAATMTELARPPRRPGSPLRPGVQHIEQLRTVRIIDSSLMLHDPALGGTWRLGIARLDLQRLSGGGVRGSATATLALGVAPGPAQATVTLQADLATDGGTQLQLALLPMNAGAMHQAAPDLSPDARLDAPVQALGTLHLNAGLQPTMAALRVEAGGGRMRMAGSPIAFDSLALSAEAAWDSPAWSLPQRVALQRAKAVLHAPGGAWPTIVTLSGQAALTPTSIAGTAEAKLDHLAFADIGSLWPERLGGHIRPWLVQNVTAGTARDAAVKVGFHGPHDLSDLVVTTAEGSLRGDDATIHWLSPVPPVEGAQAMLTIRDADSLDIAVASARQGPLHLKDGLIHITGLSEKDQFMVLDANASGGVPDMLTLLRHPRLALLDRKPIPMRNPAGAFTGHMTISLPLNEDVEMEDIKIKTSVRLTDLRLGGLVAGRDLERGAIQMEATSDMLKASGTAVVAGIPADISVGMEFRDGPASQVVQRAQAVGRATGRQLAAAGWFDPGGLMGAGAGVFTAKFLQRRDNSAEVQLNGDLSGAALSLVGWTKPQGQPAEVSARLLLRGDKMLGIDLLHAQGPGMALDGHIEMVGADPLLLVLDRIELGPTRGRGQVRFPDRPSQPIRATLTGAVLDLAPQLAQQSTPPGAAADPPFVIDARFDRVLLAPNRGLGGLVAHAEHDGRRLTTLTATTMAPEQVELTIRPEGNRRRLRLNAADGGALLKAVDLLDTVYGGVLKLEGVFDDAAPNAPLTARVELSNFNVRNGRLLGKLLQAITIYGLLDALNGPGVAFNDLVLPFRWDGTMLDVTDMRAFSASLGLTAKGRINAERKTIDMQGTVVPLYMINAVLGRLPLVGGLFSAERGGGLVAFNYSMSGAVGDPTVTVNPLSALTPGFLRGLFHMFD